MSHRSPAADAASRNSVASRSSSPVVHETLGQMVTRLSHSVSTAIEQRDASRKLADLDSRLLVDIGIAPGDVAARYAVVDLRAPIEVGR